VQCSQQTAQSAIQPRKLKSNSIMVSAYMKQVNPKAKLEHAFARFETQEEVAKALGVSGDTVRRLRNVYGMLLPRPSTKYTGKSRRTKPSVLTNKLRSLEAQGVELLPSICASHLGVTEKELLNWTKCMRWHIGKRMASVKGFEARLGGVNVTIGKSTVSKFTHRVEVELIAPDTTLIVTVNDVKRFVHDVLHSIGLAWLVQS